MSALSRFLAAAFASLALQASAIDYFGYAHTEGVGGEVAPWTNVGHFLVEDPAFDYSGQINHWKVVYGMKSVIELTHVFVPGRTGDLLPDWRARLATFVATNRRCLTPEFVAALLVMDEPLLRGMRADDVAALAAAVKEVLPGIPTALVESAGLTGELPDPIAPVFDWVGMDAYGVREPAEDSWYLARLDDLQRRMRPPQALVIVGDGWYGPVQREAGLTPCEMADVAWSYYRLAVERGAVALIFFAWKSDAIQGEVAVAVGSDRFDDCSFCSRRAINTQRVIGALVTGKTPRLGPCARRHLRQQR